MTGAAFFDGGAVIGVLIGGAVDWAVELPPSPPQAVSVSVTSRIPTKRCDPEPMAVLNISTPEYQLTRSGAGRRSGAAIATQQVGVTRTRAVTRTASVVHGIHGHVAFVSVWFAIPATPPS